jgi:branched-chain amino acid transport system permease protein
LRRSAWPPPRLGRREVVAAAIAVLAVAALATDRAALQSSLLGLGSGALIAALALGIVVTYRGSGVVSLSAGAMAMYASYVFNSLTKDGQLLVIGWRVDLGAPWDFVPGLVMTTAVSAVLGIVVYVLIFAPLREASPVAKIVASVGLLLVLQSIVILQYGATSVPATVALSNGAVTLPWDLVVPVNQLVLGGAVVLAGVLLWAVYRFTRPGLATRAAAEDEQRLTMIGLSPMMVSGGNWMFAAMVIGIFGALIVPINGAVDPNTLTLLVVPALAAALLGRFTSFGWAIAGGLGIGMVQALIQYLGTKSWYPTAQSGPLPGVRETVPLVIILVALAFQRRGIGGRGAIGSVQLPFAPPPRNVLLKLVVVMAVATAGFLFFDPAWRLAQLNTVIGVMVCLSFVILTGFVGQVSLAQMSLAGLSGFTLAKLGTDAGLGFPIAPLLGALVAAAAGVLMGLSALRIRGVQLAIVTMAAALAIESLVFRNPVWSKGLLGATVEAPQFLGLAFGPTDPSGIGDGSVPNPWFGIVCLAVVGLFAWLTCMLRTSGWGRRMLAVRANERAVTAAGISVKQTKIVAFALAAFVAGVAGALSGYRFGSVTPEYFGVFASITFLAFAYMGGIASVTGAVIGGMLVTNGLVFTALDRWLGVPSSYTLLVGGLGLILTVVLNPQGIAGSLRETATRLRRSPQPEWDAGR